ncbi:type II toxin-antitoxin system CcdA family antitoxin [Steroidobacter flavus]|uniref:Type II toxin-antitoxin system CcdA family antitoxin n=1 Tax=Steroidobacter flavus TaxID=1842136 RepID=A0ABV8SXL5_9GAMM
MEPPCHLPVASQRRASRASTSVGIWLEATRAAKINLSATLEQALVKKLSSVPQLQWRQENRDSIEAYNQHVEKHGGFYDKSQSF